MLSFGFAVSAFAEGPWRARGRTGLGVTGPSGRILGRRIAKDTQNAIGVEELYFDLLCGLCNQTTKIVSAAPVQCD